MLLRSRSAQQSAGHCPVRSGVGVPCRRGGWWTLTDRASRPGMPPPPRWVRWCCVVPSLRHVHSAPHWLRVWSRSASVGCGWECTGPATWSQASRWQRSPMRSSPALFDRRDPPWRDRGQGSAGEPAPRVHRRPRSTSRVGRATSTSSTTSGIGSGWTGRCSRPPTTPAAYGFVPDTLATARTPSCCASRTWRLASTRSTTSPRCRIPAEGDRPLLRRLQDLEPGRAPAHGVGETGPRRSGHVRTPSTGSGTHALGADAGRAAAGVPRRTVSCVRSGVEPGATRPGVSLRRCSTASRGPSHT